MRILFAGSAPHSAQVLRHLLQGDNPVVGVLTKPDSRRGRGRKHAPTEVRLLAEQHGLPVLTPARIDAEVADQITGLEADVAVVVAYGLLIPQSALDCLPHGWYNIHYSLLPRWRGAAPVQFALANADEQSGVTIFKIDSGLDSGPVATQVETTIEPKETAGELLNRLHQLSLPALDQVLGAISDGSVKLHPQPEQGITHASKISVESARIDWTAPWEEVDRKVRAFNPHPGAWTTLEDGTRIKILAVSRGECELLAGEVLVQKKQVLVGTGSDSARLELVSAAGKKTMPGPDWARGARLHPKTILGGK